MSDLWTGTVTAVTAGRARVAIPRISARFVSGPSQVASGLTVAVGTKVLVTSVDAYEDRFVVVAVLP